MTVTKFTPVARSVRRIGACPECGRKTSRSATFDATVNPFNVNADGEVKDYAEVAADLEAACAAWVPDFRHPGCGGRR